MARKVPASEAGMAFPRGSGGGGGRVGLGHEDYPREGCGDQDGAPADTVVRRDDGSYLVTAHGMVAVVPPDYRWRKSPDARIHVCIRRLRSGAEYLVCAFRGPDA